MIAFLDPLEYGRRKSCRLAAQIFVFVSQEFDLMSDAFPHFGQLVDIVFEFSVGEPEIIQSFVLEGLRKVIRVKPRLPGLPPRILRLGWVNH